MQTVYALKNDKSWESLLIHEGNILMMNSSFNDPEAFLKSYGEKGLFKKKKEISIASITKLEHLEHNPLELKISFGSNKSENPLFTSTQDLEEVTSILAKETKLVAATQKLTAFKAASAPLIALLVTALLGWVIYMDAQTLEAGGTVNTSGRRSLFKQLFAWVAEMLGSTGTLVTASAIALVCILLAYKKAQNPPNLVVYS